MEHQNLQANSADELVLHAPAKLNLSLAVLDRRPDGFHEIESLMVPVSVSDQLHVRRAPAGVFSLEVTFAGKLGCEQHDGYQLSRS